MRWKRNGDGRVAPKGRTRYSSSAELPERLRVTKCPFGGKLTASSELIRRVEAHGAFGGQHRRVPFTHFLLLVFFAFFLCLVFLPFAIFGRIFRTLSISVLFQDRTSIPPMTWAAGAGTFSAAMYRFNAVLLIPSFLAASRVEYPLISGPVSQIRSYVSSVKFPGQ